MTAPRLSPGDDQHALCGACGRLVARIELDAHLTSEPAPRLLRFWGGGWRFGSDGVYRLPERAKRAVRGGHSPRSRRPAHRARPDGPAVDLVTSPRELPAPIECPWCSDVQLFDHGGPLRLDGVYAPRETDDELPPEAFRRVRPPC